MGAVVAMARKPFAVACRDPDTGRQTSLTYDDLRDATVARQLVEAAVPLEGCLCAQEVPSRVKRDVVRVARRGDLSHAEVVADFGISIESVRRWVRQAEVDDGVVDGQTTSEHNELVAGGALRSVNWRWRTRSCAALRPTSLLDRSTMSYPLVRWPAKGSRYG